MFRLSTLDSNTQRTLVLEGKLVSPWTEELESAWRSAQQRLEGRKLIIDLTDVTVIGSDGENTLLNLMREGARFTGCGVLTKHLLKQLARRCRCPQ
jgi:ABC-type transporter Mla MlaB component